MEGRLIYSNAEPIVPVAPPTQVDEVPTPDKAYRVAKVNSPTSITITRAYAHDSASGAYTIEDARMGLPTDRCRSRVADALAMLRSKRAVSGLRRDQEMKLDLATRTATALSAPIVPCRTAVMRLVGGQWVREAYSLSLFALNRLVYDPDESVDITKAVGFMRASFGDEGLEAWLDWMAYCLVPGNDFKKILTLIGATNSGKSTMAKMIEDLLASSDEDAKNCD